MPPKSKPRWNTITIKLPDEFYNVSKTGRVTIKQPLTDKGNVKTIDKKKAVILTTAKISEPTISGGNYQTEGEVNKSGKIEKGYRKSMGHAKEEAKAKKLKKEHGTKKRTIDTLIRQDIENVRKNGEMYMDGKTKRDTPFKDKAVVMSNIKNYHEKKKLSKEQMAEKMAHLRSLRGKPKN